MHLNNIHKRVIDFLINTDKPIFLTGKAGTGKTTFLHYIKKNITKNMAVVAPTAIAALNAGGVTINSFFQIPFGPLIPDKSAGANIVEKTSRMAPDKLKLLAGLQLLIIDEISMVRADMIDRIDSILKNVKGSSRPFGGVQLLMIGDLYQLPPVYQQDWPVLKAFYTGPYFFNSLIFNSFPIVSFELTEVFRQSDHTFIQILNSIRNADIDERLLTVLNKQFKPAIDSNALADYITLSTHNNSVSKINDSRLEGLKGELLIYKATIGGDFPKDAYPAEPELRIKTGAQIIFIKNDSSGKKQYYNGRAAKVIEATQHQLRVRFLDDGSEFEVAPEIWENIKYSLNEAEGKIAESSSGSFTQYPIKLAWAITIHKSQGLTFDKAIVDVEAAFASGQTYVALSRCKSLEGLVLKAPVKVENVITDTRITTFMRDIIEQNRVQEMLDKVKIEQEYNAVADLFDYNIIQQEWVLLQSMIIHSDNTTQALSSCYKEVEEVLVSQVKKVADKFLLQGFSKLIPHQPFQEQTMFRARLKQAAAYFEPRIKDLIGLVERLLTLPIEKDVDADFFSIYNQLMSHLKGKLAALQIDLSVSEPSDLLVATTEAMMRYYPLYQFKKETVSTKLTEVKNPLLLKELLSWREAVSKERNVADYLVLSDQLCVTIANKLPRSLGELAQIKGVGAGKATDLGDGFVKIIRNYLGENDLFA